MLKVTLHSGRVNEATLHNMLGKLDLGYTKLAAVANYKAELFTCGFGAHPIIDFNDYPRWSVSVWDLVMRIVCRSQHGGDVLPIPSITRRSGAYAIAMCAIIEHWEDGEVTRRSTIGTAQLTMASIRCTYRCELNDDLTGSRTSNVFRFVPEALNHWDLLCCAIAMTDYDTQVIPGKPPLMLPSVFEYDGKKLIALGTLRRPARDAIVRWLSRMNIEPRQIYGRHGGVIDESTYVRFLNEAV